MAVEEIVLCETVCRAASLKGWKLTERARGPAVFYAWLSPDGAEHHCANRPDAPQALAAACRWWMQNDSK